MKYPTFSVWSTFIRGIMAGFDKPQAVNSMFIPSRWNVPSLKKYAVEQRVIFHLGTLQPGGVNIGLTAFVPPAVHQTIIIP